MRRIAMHIDHSENRFSRIFIVFCSSSAEQGSVKTTAPKKGAASPHLKALLNELEYVKENERIKRLDDGRWEPANKEKAAKLQSQNVKFISG